MFVFSCKMLHSFHRVNTEFVWIMFDVGQIGFRRFKSLLKKPLPSKKIFILSAATQNHNTKRWAAGAEVDEPACKTLISSALISTISIIKIREVFFLNKLIAANKNIKTFVKTSVLFYSPPSATKYRQLACRLTVIDSLLMCRHSPSATCHHVSLPPNLRPRLL